MVNLIAGVAVLAVTVALFWYCLPRGGKTHRFVGTEFEPYVGVAFCSATALGFTLLISGALAMLPAEPPPGAKDAPSSNRAPPR